MPLASNTRIQLAGTFSSVFDGKAINADFNFNVVEAMATGVGLDQADVAWWETGRALAATSEDLDLSGTMTDAYGATVAFAKVKGVFIRNKSTVAGEIVTIGGAATNQFALFGDVTDDYPIGPGGTFMVWEPSLAGKTVVAGTGDLFKIDSGAATLTYDVCIIGTSS